MDIEAFYDADPRRRASDEVSFGRDWFDADGVRWELNWVADTGELYVMREPSEPVEMDALGDAYIQDLPTSELGVKVLGVIEGRNEVHEALTGWQDAMAARGGLDWVAERIAAVG
ncbi:MAG: hypothetical protein ACOYOP_04805 [Microthrixaceae bacterium]